MSPLEPASVASSPGGGGEEGRAPPPRWDAGRREERGTPKTGRRMSAPEVSTPERGGAFHEGQAPAFQRQRAGSFDDSGRGGGDGRYGEVYRHPGAEDRSEGGWEGGAHLPPAHNPSAPVFRASTEDWPPTDGGPSTAAGPRPPDPSLYGAGAYPGTPGEYLARRPPRPNQESGPFDGARDSTPARGRAVGDPAATPASQGKGHATPHPRQPRSNHQLEPGSECQDRRTVGRTPVAKGTPAWTRGPKVGVVPLYARVLAFESTVRTCLGALMAEAREGEEVDADAPTTSRYFLGGDCDVLQWSFQVAEAVVGREGVPAAAAPLRAGGAAERFSPGALQSSPQGVGRRLAGDAQSIRLHLDKLKIVSSKGTWEALKKLSGGARGADSSHGIRKQVHVRLAKFRDGDFVRVGEGQSAVIPLSQLQGSACAGVPDAGAVELLLQLKGANDTVVAQCVEKVLLPSQFLGAEDRITRMCQLHRDGEVIAKASVSYHTLAAAAQGAPPGEGLEVGKPALEVEDGGSEAFQRISVKQAYDILLRAALQAISFNQRSLRVHGPWAWLLHQFAQARCISAQHCTIQYLWWVMQAATPTVDCFHVLLERLPGVLEAGLVQGKLPKYSKDSHLSAQEHTTLSDVLLRVDRLLCLTFSSVKSLSDAAPLGLLDGHQAVPAEQLPAPSLSLAVQLFGQLHDPLAGYTQSLLRELLQDAAHKRFKCLHRDAEDAFFLGGEAPADMGVAFQQVGKLCALLKSELDLDQQLHRKGVLPTYIDFPQVSAQQYCEDVYLTVGQLLRKHPPRKPTESVLHLLLSIGGFEAELLRWGLEVPADRSSSGLFKEFVAAWMRDDVATLCARCQPNAIAATVAPRAGAGEEAAAFERVGRLSGPGGGGRSAGISATVGEICQELRHALEKYRKLIKRWPEWAPSLEKVCSKTLWELNRAIDGSWQSLAETAPRPCMDIGNLTPSKGSLLQRFKLKRAPQTDGRLTAAELLHLNSLKFVLNEIPSLRETLHGACGGLVGEVSPSLGKQFGHVETEYRNVYTRVISESVAKLAASPTAHLHGMLKGAARARAEEVQGSTQDLAGPCTEETAAILDFHGAHLFEGVWQDVARGLWNHCAGQVLRFVEKLQRSSHSAKGGKSRWHCHILAGETTQVLETFFEAALRKKLGQSLRTRDLEPPRMAKELRERVSSHGAQSLHQNSFSVF